MSLEEFNQLDTASAREALQLCCVSRRWIDGVLDARPYAGLAALKSKADEVWAGLEEADYLEAFEGHPKIGDVKSLREKYARSGSLAASEQAGVSAADEDVLQRLAAGNARYEQRFGFIFIVCASGKSAEHMCEILEARLGNSREQELRIAAEEQRKITHLRLDKLQ